MLCSPGLFLDYNSLFPLRRIFPQNFGLGLMRILLFVNDYGVGFLKVENCCKSSRPGPIDPVKSWIGECSTSTKVVQLLVGTRVSISGSNCSCKKWV